MRIKLLPFGLLVILLTFPSLSEALMIVDTGEAPIDTSDPVVHVGQWLAAEFTTNQDYIITDIKSYMSAYRSGTIDIAIYEGTTGPHGGEVPDVKNELYHSSAVVPSTYPIGPDWYGLSGLNWDLSAGTYWAAFEVRTPRTDRFGMKTPSQNPLVNEAYAEGDPMTYIAFDDTDMCLRIQGNPKTAPVPEPTTILLLGTGLFGLVGFGRKKFIQ